jgi:hypothetical protein
MHDIKEDWHEEAFPRDPSKPSTFKAILISLIAMAVVAGVLVWAGWAWRVTGWPA